MGKSPMNVVMPLGVGEGQAGMARTDRAPVVLCQAGASLPTVRALRSRDTRYPPLGMSPGCGLTAVMVVHSGIFCRGVVMFWRMRGAKFGSQEP
jgi:hypothetical protein